MKAPGTAYNDRARQKCSAHMKDYVRTVEDNGGVHIIRHSQPRVLRHCAGQGYAWEKAVVSETVSAINFRDAQPFSRHVI